MSLIQDFASWFKARRTKIEAWYQDGTGKFAFRVTVDDTPLVCTARSSARDGRTSIMKRVAGTAQVNDALIALRVGDDIHVFDPVAVLYRGVDDDPSEDDRSKRGEEWIEFDVGLGCAFDDWFDGIDEPTRYEDVADF
jgi:hypothetical protein